MNHTQRIIQLVELYSSSYGLISLGCQNTFDGKPDEGKRMVDQGLAGATETIMSCHNEGISMDMIRELSFKYNPRDFGLASDVQPHTPEYKANQLSEDIANATGNG